jgi:hypothetical protein
MLHLVSKSEVGAVVRAGRRLGTPAGLFTSFERAYSVTLRNRLGHS